MENKDTICRKCGGEAKPSKGLMNIHNLQTSDLSKEFEDKFVDCLKCENCGHSWIPYDYEKLPMNSNPSLPNWMNNSSKRYTQEEVDELLDRQAAISCNQTVKAIFKEFNPELFKRYINKFSDEDKLWALKTLVKELPESNLKKYINKWFN